MARGNETNPAPTGPSPCHARPAGRDHIILYHGIEHVVYFALVCVTALHCLQLPARPGIVTAMSLLRYVKVISKPSDASSSSSGSHAEGSSTDHDGQCHGASDDDSAEDSGPSPLKRAKMFSHTLDSKLSASEVDAILTAEVPVLGLFPIVKVRNSAATHDRLKEKLFKSRFVPSKSWVAPKRQCGQKKRVSDDFFNQELYSRHIYTVTCHKHVYLVWLCSTSITILTLISQKLFVNLILVVEELLFFIFQNHIASLSCFRCIFCMNIPEPHS